MPFEVLISIQWINPCVKSMCSGDVNISCVQGRSITPRKIASSSALNEHHNFAHGITITSWLARLRIKSPAVRLFTLPFIQAQIKENIKVPRHWPLCGEFPAQMASNAENVFIWWRHHVLCARMIASFSTLNAHHNFAYGAEHLWVTS